MSKKCVWRFRNASYIYVDSNIGDDINGLGTQDSPYQTLGKAWRSKQARPSYIICRGYFSEDMLDGNHSCTIQADYLGAAVFDGNGKYYIYGFSLPNMIVRNCPIGKVDLVPVAGTGYLAGVGRSYGSGGVGYAIADDLVGLGGTYNIVGDSGMYFGLVGGSGSHNAVFNPMYNSTYKLWMFFYNSPTNWSIHGVPYDKRIPSRNQTGSNIKNSIFTNCCFFARDNIHFYNCYFGSDCTWYADENTKIEIEGATSRERIDNLKKYFTDHNIVNPCTFDNLCTFLDIPASEIFQNADEGDFVVKSTSGIPHTVGMAGVGFNVPILNEGEIDEHGAECAWDNYSIEGAIKIDNNEILIDEDSPESYGRISTGIIDLKSEKVSLKNLRSIIPSSFDNFIGISDTLPFGTDLIDSTSTIPSGKYKVVSGNLTIGELDYTAGDIITALKDFSFTTTDDAKIVSIKDYNNWPVVYVRNFSHNTSIINSTSGGITLSGTVEKPLYFVFRGKKGLLTTEDTNKTLVDGSVIELTTDGVVTSNMGEFSLQVLSNDSTNEWMPLSPYGEAFVGKKQNVIQRDKDGIPLSSGNINSFDSATNSASVVKTYLEGYIQFKIEIRKLVW